MAYTDFLNILKMSNGGNENTWGTETNKNWDRVVASISGYNELTITTEHISTVTPYDLTTAEGADPSATEDSGNGYYKVIFFKGSPSARSYIKIGPTNSGKYYLVVNGTGQTLRVYQDGVTRDSKAITTVSAANPAVVTAASHPFENGDSVFITGVTGGGSTAATVNDKYFTATKLDANTFSIDANTSGGSVSDTDTGTAYGEPAVYVDVLNGFSSILLAAGNSNGLSGSNTNGVFRILDDMEFDFIKTTSGIVAGNVTNTHVPYAKALSGYDGGLVGKSTFTFTEGTDTLTVSKIGAFEAAGAINFASQNMTNVDIDSGTINATTLALSTIDTCTINNTNQSGGYNVAVGTNALDSLTVSSGYNTGIGNSAGTALDNNAANNVLIGNLAGNTMSGADVFYNVAVGSEAGQMAGEGNVAVGHEALSNVGAATGQADDQNTAIGYKSMGDCNNGTNYNVAVGAESNFGGQGSSAANGSVAIGRQALYVEQTHGSDPNVAVGLLAGRQVGSGGGNVFVGQHAARYSVSGITNNVAIGSKALFGKDDSTFEGDQNVAVGSLALENVEGASDSNTCVGYNSGNSVTTGDGNVCIGWDTGRDITTATYNTLIGPSSGRGVTGSNNTAVGVSAMLSTSAATGSDNICIGNSAGRDMGSSSRNIILGKDTAYYGTGNANDIFIVDSNIGFNPSSYDLSAQHYIYGDMANHTINFNNTTSGASHVKIQNTGGTASDKYFLQCFNDSDDGSGGNEVFRVDLAGGTKNVSGTVSALADYADMFEWSDGNPEAEDRIGLSVVIDENSDVEAGVRPATSSDDPKDIVGIVSGTACILGNAAWGNWDNKYLKDDFGRSTEELNPDFDESLEYIPRQERQEWAVIGLTGRIHIRKGSPTHPCWRKIRDVSSVVEEWLVR